MINLGDKVKDSVSNFQGIAVARHSYLQGCDRITIQPPVDKDGRLPESMTFDAPQIDVTEEGTVKRKAPKDNSGGPEKYSDARKY